MIVEFIFNIFFVFLNRFMGVFPDIDWSIPSNVLDTIENIIKTCCYFLPMNTVAAILGIVLWMTLFRIGVSFIKTLWQIIPFL